MRYTYVCDRHGVMVLSAPVAERNKQQCPECGRPLSRQFDPAEIEICIPMNMRAENDHEPVLPTTPGEIATAKDECFVPADSRWV